MRTRDIVSVGCGLAALGVGVFALGGVERWVQAITAALVAAALIPQIMSRRVLDRVSPLVALPALALVLSAVQLIPLPHVLLEHLDAVGDALRSDGAELLGLHPSNTLSLDPPATLRALTFFTVLLGVAILALRIAVSEKGRYRLLALVAITCGVGALVIGIHTVLGAKQLYGIYTPKEAQPSVLGPLLNQNHLGCLMGIGTVTAIGLVLYRRQQSWIRATWLLIVGACGAATVATHSRGATLALIVSSLLAVGLWFGQRFVARDSDGRGRSRFSMTSLPLIIVSACAVVVVVYASAGGVSERLSKTSVEEAGHPKSKFMAWRSAAQLIEEAPFLGIGRGALEPAFTRVHPASAVATYAFVENEYVQAVVDWGLLGAICLGLALMWLIVTAVRRWRDGPLAAGAIGVLAMVLVQSNVDFGVEMLGVAIPVTIVAATLAYVPLKEAANRRLQVRRSLRVALVGGLVLSIYLLLSPKTETLAEAHARLQQGAPTLDDVKQELTSHPLDYFGYALAATLLDAKGDKEAVRLLNHAMELHPSHPGLHSLAAHLLLRAGRTSQAAIEYGLALRGSLEPRALLKEITTVFSPTNAATAIPTDYVRLDEIANTLVDLGHRDVAIAWLDRVLDRGATMHACEQIYAVTLPTNDVKILAATSRRCVEFDPGRDTRIKLANLFLASNEYDQTLALLADVETWDGRIDEKRNAWLMTCDAHAGKQEWDVARHCLHSIEGAGLSDAATTALIVKRLEKITLEQTGHAPIP